MKPLSMDLRERLLDAVDKKQMTRLDIARIFNVSTAIIRRFVQRRREGESIAPKPHAGGPKPVLQEPQLELLRAAVAEKNDATLVELGQALAKHGIVVGKTTVSKGLKKLGLTRKKRRSGPANGRVRRSGCSGSNIAKRLMPSIPSG
jgi:transposase